MQAYGLDLARHPLHWWQFRALFRSLPEETQLVKIIGYRTMKIPAKASKEQRQHYEHLKQNMTVHRWFANKACPGDYLYQRHGAIAEAVNAKLGTGTEQTVSSFPAVPFTVRVIINDLNYREGPGMSYAVKGQTGNYDHPLAGYPHPQPLQKLPLPPCGLHLPGPGWRLPADRCGAAQ